MSQLQKPGNGGGGSGIQTINGDTGSITGSTVTIYADNAANNSGATVEFINSGTVSTLDVTDSKNNTFVGKLAGDLTRSPVLCSNNTSLGYGSLAVANTTNQCTAIGFSALSSQTGGQHQTAVGTTSLANSVTSNQNSALGAGSGNSNIDGNDNCYFGFNAAEMMPHGSSNVLIGSKVAINILGTANNNTIIGYQAGNHYILNESSNVLISNAGVASENNVIRIGTQGTGAGQQDECFIAGITGVIAVGSPVAVSSTGELSDLGFGTATQVLTSNGAGVSPTWQAAGGGGSVSLLFSTYLSATILDVTGDSTVYTIPWNTAPTNVGTCLNTSTGVFTAPATATYLFTGNVTMVITNPAETQMFASLVTTANTYQMITNNGYGAAGNGILGIPWSKQVNMSIGDTASITTTVTGSVSKDSDVAGTVLYSYWECSQL